MAVSTVCNLPVLEPTSLTCFWTTSTPSLMLLCRTPLLRVGGVVTGGVDRNLGNTRAYNATDGDAPPGIDVLGRLVWQPAPGAAVAPSPPWDCHGLAS